MQTERPDLSLVRQKAGASPAADNSGPATEALLLNLEASARVFSRSQFYGWTQGLLQGLLAHKVLICAFRVGESSSYRVDGFSMAVEDGEALASLLLENAGIVPGLTQAWKQNHLMPVVVKLKDLGAVAGSTLARRLEKIGATDLLIHGGHDVGGEARSLVVFACVPNTVSQHESNLAQLIVPLLDAAWIRAHVADNGNGIRAAPVGSGVLTPREREILHWISLGKSNPEIGAILGISPLTVKNHVQKILRKLNVVNRAQAVGKALDARIISS